MIEDDRPAGGQDPAGGPTGAGGPTPPPGASGRDEAVGSVGEEAAKLFGALSQWAREHAGDPGEQAHGSAHPDAVDPHDPLDPSVHAHGPAGADPAGGTCRWCPVCRTVHLVRQTSPEVKLHLAQAAGSLVQAASGLLATYTAGTTSGPRGPQVEKIHLDDDTDWDEDQD